MSENKTVKVACTVPNGIFLQLYKEGFDDGTGVKRQVYDGPAVRLNGVSALHGVAAMSASDVEPGITEVDEKWWSSWMAQNKDGNPLVTAKHVWLLDEDEKKAENPTL